MKAILSAAVLALALLPAPAAALCSGASLQREYREADLVVRARVVAESRHDDAALRPAFRARWGDYTPVTLHRLRVQAVFKGRPGAALNLFQTVDSGRFPVDVGGDYLLFLNYTRPYPGMGSMARGSVRVRYACGQSMRWNRVPARRLAGLRALSLHR
jgi:hypothetical protein